MQNELTWKLDRANIESAYNVNFIDFIPFSSYNSRNEKLLLHYSDNILTLYHWLSIINHHVILRLYTFYTRIFFFFSYNLILFICISQIDYKVLN